MPLPPEHRWVAPAASAAVYVLLTAWLGRDVLTQLGTVSVFDTGDPLLNAGILYWNAWTRPLSDAWWQFPIFYPTADALAFSEHLLGLSVIATPIAWATRDALVTANLATLLTFPLCALSMYALAARLTGRRDAAFVAGLACGFAPYRVEQLQHVQMLATFWAPLALLALHAFIESRRRRWLLVYGAAWLLQAAANGYYLFYFTAFIAAWCAWFVIARRRWRALVEIAGATAVAALPLVPILLRYLEVHQRHGFSRAPWEASAFGADLLGLLCAPADLTVWGWLRVGCRPEGALFPGVAIALLSAVCVLALAQRNRGPAVPTAARSTLAFYAGAAAITWALALGPTLFVLGDARGDGWLPFAWLMRLPGFDEVRVPARFWMLSSMSLAVVAGHGAAVLTGRRAGAAALAVCLACAAGVAVDGWVRVPTTRAPAGPPNPTLLRGAVVLFLPAGSRPDTEQAFAAVAGGWMAVNGHSGYEPRYFPVVRYAVRFERDALFAPFRARTDLHLVVRADAPRLQALVERQPGATTTGRSAAGVQYLLPRQPAGPAPVRGERHTPARVESWCAPESATSAIDGDPSTAWSCPRQTGDEAISLDLGAVKPVGGFTHLLGAYTTDFPRELVVEASLDGRAWETAWQGDVVAQAIEGALADPRSPAITIAFPPRPARYLRLRQVAADEGAAWSIPELEIWSGTASP